MQPNRKSGHVHTVILILFFFSGASGLIYEVIWQGMLNLVFGNTTFATTTVIASFMGGMALGSYFFGRFADRFKNPLKLYAYLEIGIGVFALLFPYLLSAVSNFQLSIFRAFPTTLLISNVIRFILCFTVLLIPSILMGGTLPVVSRFYITTVRHLSRGVGRLYGINTFGGVAGTFCAIFFLISSFGARQITYTAAAINLAIATAAFVLSRTAFPSNRKDTTQKEAKTTEPRHHVYPESVRRIVLIVYGMSGFCALAYEVLWTRILAFFLGNSTHAFAVMLTTYLLGLALGSLLFARLLDKVKHRLILLGFIEVCIGLSALLSLWEFSILGGVLDRTLMAFGGNWTALIFSRYLGAFIIMSIPTLLIGIAFPLVNKIYAGSFAGLSRGIGSVYSVNTCGSILGSIAAGFFLIPTIGITKSVIVIALINTLLGTLAALSTMLTSRKLRWAPAATGISVVVVLVILITAPSIRFHGYLPGQKLLYYKEGASSTVSVVENKKGYKFLVVNGVYEVSTDYNSLRTFHMLGHLPLLLHEDPEKALVISFGAGVTSGAVASHNLKQIDAVEISSEAIDANSFFVEENQAVLTDPRVNLIIDDGRNYLLRTETRYDVITADATHPTGSDSWVLYTKEFYDLCKRRLKPNGFMAQWLPVHALAPVDYKAIVKTFQSVFPDATLWFTNDYTILLGSINELAIDFSRFTERLQEPDIRKDLESFNLADPDFFLGSYIMGGDALAAYCRDARLNTDNYPFVQSSEKRSRMGTNPSNLMELSGMMDSVEPLLYNTGPERDRVVSEIDKHSAVVKHIIRARAFYYMGDIPRQIEEYEKALAILPGDKNTAQMLQIARDVLDDYGVSP